MLFSSMTFLWIFLPTVIIVNFVLSLVKFKSESTRIKYKNFFLLFASLFFYAWGGIYYLLIMLSSIVINFIGGHLISRFSDEPKKRKLSLVIVIILNLGILFFFKYFNMLGVVIESVMLIPKGVSTAFGQMLSMEGTGALGLPYIVLPIGISFFTFQSMSYVIDVYMGKAKLQKNIFDFALYVSLFPQLIAGSIVKYSDIELQLDSRQETISYQYCKQALLRYSFSLGNVGLKSIGASY